MEFNMRNKSEINKLDIQEWSSFLIEIDVEEEFPPSSFTWLLAEAGIMQLKLRLKNGKNISSIAELGAKEGAISCWFSKFVSNVIATEIDQTRLNIINNNIKKLNTNNVVFIESEHTRWFPDGIDWAKVDIFLVNPPSVPKPPKIPPPFNKDRFVLFSGPDGRYEIRNIIAQAQHVLSENAELLLVGADYVLDNWLITECSKYGLFATEIMRNRVESKEGEIDWIIHQYIQFNLGWKKFELTKSSLWYEQVAYSIYKTENISAI